MRNLGIRRTAVLTDIAGIKDPARYAWRHRIIDAEPGETSVRITWDDGRVSLFHYLWLRDNCGCAACTHPKTLERTFDLLSVPETIRADAVSITETGGLSDRIRIMRSPRGEDRTRLPKQCLRIVQPELI